MVQARAGVHDRDGHARAVRTAPTRPGGRRRCRAQPPIARPAGRRSARLRRAPRTRTRTALQRPEIGSGGGLGPPPARYEPTRPNVHRRQRNRVGSCGGRWCSWRSGSGSPLRLRRRSRCASRPRRIASSTRAVGVGLKSVYGLDVQSSVRPADGRRCRHLGARRRRRRSGGRVLLEPAGVAARHRHAPRRSRDDLPGPCGPGRAPQVPARVRQGRGGHPAPPERRVLRAHDARAARPQPGRDRRSPPGGRRRRVHRRQRAGRRLVPPARASGSSSASWPSPRTRRSRTCTPRRCAPAASA